MIGAATARLRLSKQQNRRTSTPNKNYQRRRSQSPGAKNLPHSLLSATSSPAHRRGSCSVNLLSGGTNGQTTTGNNSLENRLKVPIPFPHRKRSGSVPAIAWNIKPDFVRGIKVTWARLCDTPRSTCKGIVAIMDKVFEKFESKEKTLKEVFYNSAFVDSMVEHRSERRRSGGQNIATLRDHIHFFVSLISQVVHSLELPPQEIFEHIDKIGCFHAQLRKYGFRASMFDKLGECLLDALVVQDCVRGFPEACKGWTVLIAALIDRLRSAPKHLTALPITGKLLSRPDRLPSPFHYERFSPTHV
uniref:Uncharacterized protein n=1 Tax=Panagrolaimus superbus TaxID=310955 RepID=A0A914Y4E1_9BILA